MSGQKPQAFRPGPGYSAPSVSAAPTVQTQTYRATAAAPQVNTQGLQNLGAALGGFFGGIANAAAEVDKVDHQQQLVQIDRENQALAQEALADQGTGKAPNPEHMSRQAYAGTYTAALADGDADKLATGLRERLNTMKLDGSESAQGIAEDYFKQQIGNGTGNAEYDARVIHQYKGQADRMIVAQDETVRQTVEKNAWETVRTDTARQMTSQGGVTVGQVADLNQRILTMARGDQVVADSQMESILGEAIMNDGNALSALNAMEQLGYAKRNPDSYLRLSQRAFERTNAIKTFQAGADVQQWHQDFMAAQVAAKASGMPMSPETVLQLTQRAYAIDSRHGVGQDKFMGALGQAWQQAVTTTAAINLVKAAYFGELDGMRDGALITARFGEPMGALLTKHYDQGIAAIAQQSNQASGGTMFAELVRTAKGGILDPLASPKAAQEFAQLAGSEGMRRASPEGLSKTYRVQIGNALIGADPHAAMNAYAFLSTYETAMGSPEGVRQALNGDAEFMAYQAAKQFAATGRNVADHFTRRQTIPEDVAALSKESKGQFDWPTLIGNPSAKTHEVEADVRSRIASNLREAVGRDAWFGKPGMVFESTQAEGQAFSAVAQFLREQRRSGGSLNVSDAVEAALPLIRSQFVTLPGQGKTMVLVRDPYGGKGRNVDHPIAVHAGRPVYAGFPIKNKLGEVEDPVKTFREDMEGMRQTLPGLLAAHGVPVSADSMFLMRPDAITGLHPIARSTGEQVTLYPGMQLTLPGQRRYKKASTPLDSWVSPEFETRPDIPDAPWEDAGKSMGKNPLGLMATNAKGLLNGTVASGPSVAVSSLAPTLGSPEVRREPSAPWSDQVRYTTPTAPAEFEKVIAARLPPGVFLIPGPYHGPRGERSYGLAYGFRVKGDQSALDKTILKRADDLPRAERDRADHEAWMRQRQQDLNPRRETPVLNVP